MIYLTELNQRPGECERTKLCTASQVHNFDLIMNFLINTFITSEPPSGMDPHMSSLLIRKLNYTTVHEIVFIKIKPS